MSGIALRPMLDRDVGQVFVWRNDPEIRRYMLTQHEITLDEHHAWFARASADQSRRLLIVEDEGRPFGCVNFSGVRPGGVADWGFYTAPDAPKGSGSKLGQVALDYAFRNAGLHKVCGQALAYNGASIRLHEGLGFRREGVLRDQHLVNGGYHDLICFGLLCHEWTITNEGE